MFVPGRNRHRLVLLSIGLLSAAFPVAAFQISPQSPHATPANPTSAEAPAPSGQAGSLSGKVTDAQSGSPITSGWVVANPRGGGPEGFGARIQPDGSYRIYRLEPGTYFVRLIADGYPMVLYRPQESSEQTSIIGPGAPVSVLPKAETPGIDFKVPKLGAITGKVVDETGRPLPFSQLRALVAIPGEGSNGPRMMPRGIGRSDERGEYRISSLEPGEYLLVVEQAPAVRIANFIDHTDPFRDIPLPTYETTYYPGVEDQAAATSIRIGPGEEKHGIDFRLKPSGGYSISGTFLLPDGSPAAESVVIFSKSAESEGGTIQPIVQTYMSRPSGRFVRNGVADGRYKLLGATSGTATVAFLNADIVVAGADLKDLVFQMQPGANIKGTLRLDGAVQANSGTSLSRSRIFVQPVDAKETSSFYAMGGVRRSPTEVSPDASGAFSLNDLPPLRYKLRAILPEGHYIARVSQGAQDVSISGVDLTQSSGDAEVQLVARADGGTITGITVGQSGAVQGGVVVRIFPAGANVERDDFQRRAVSDQNGRFSLESVPPGDYVLIAFPAGTHSDASQNASPALAALRKEGVAVTLRSGAQLQLEAKVQTLASSR